jgi:hypothetical protein
MTSSQMQLATIPCLWWSMHAYHDTYIEELTANNASIAQLFSRNLYRYSVPHSHTLLLRSLVNRLTDLSSHLRAPFSIRIAKQSELKQRGQAIADEEPGLSASMPLSTSGGESANV